MENKKERKYRVLRSHMIIPLITVMFFLISSPSYAHKVYIFAWAEGETIHTESYFGGKKKVNGGLIRIFDLSGKELLKGNTNENGGFSFKVPRKTDMRIVLESSMGHRAEYMFGMDEFSGTTESPADKIENRESKVSHPSNVVPDMGKIKVMIEEVLDSRLKPISKRLARIEEEKGPGITEIIGGIGYILGIMGIVLYLKARKRQPSRTSNA
ncbi:hypothetical protein ACFL0H_09615 [Thermodesulfobacteriota bacterium]